MVRSLLLGQYGPAGGSLTERGVHFCEEEIGARLVQGCCRGVFIIIPVMTVRGRHGACYVYIDPVNSRIHVGSKDNTF